MSNKIKVWTIQEMLEDAKKKMQTAMKKAAEDIAWKVEEKYETCIDAFYKSYPPGGGEPPYYDRGYNLYNASSAGALGNTYANVSVSSDEFTSGIIVSGDNMSDPYKDPASYVLKGAFVLGYHGTSKTGSVLPTKRILDKWWRQFKSPQRLGPFLGKYIKAAGL